MPFPWSLEAATTMRLAGNHPSFLAALDAKLIEGACRQLSTFDGGMGWGNPSSLCMLLCAHTYVHKATSLAGAKYSIEVTGAVLISTT